MTILSSKTPWPIGGLFHKLRWQSSLQRKLSHARNGDYFRVPQPRPWEQHPKTIWPPAPWITHTHTKSRERSKVQPQKQSCRNRWDHNRGHHRMWTNRNQEVNHHVPDSTEGKTCPRWLAENGRDAKMGKGRGGRRRWRGAHESLQHVNSWSTAQCSPVWLWKENVGFRVSFLDFGKRMLAFVCPFDLEWRARPHNLV